MGLITTWTELETARDSVADGEIFAEGVNDTAGYAVRLRRHGIDMIAEVREGDADWQPVDSDPDDFDGRLGVISLRDVDPDVDFHTVID